MAYKSFFGGEDDEYFDIAGRPKRPGAYEFRRYDGRKIIYTLDFSAREEAQEGAQEESPEKEAAPRLKVVRASRLEDFPNPAHDLKSLDGEWIRFLGDQRQE